MANETQFLGTLSKAVSSVQSLASSVGRTQVALAGLTTSTQKAARTTQELDGLNQRIKATASAAQSRTTAQAQASEASRPQTTDSKPAPSTAATGLLDRLYPETKALRTFRNEQKLLNEVLASGALDVSDYQDALKRLEGEYQRNQFAASTLGQVTQASLGFIDQAFADKWKSVLTKSDDFMKNLKERFKGFLAEMLHLAITKPIVVQVGAALGVGGLAGKAAGVLGGGTDSGGLSLGNVLNSISSGAGFLDSGLFKAVQAGWGEGQGLFGGLKGAFNSGSAYVSDGLSGLFGNSVIDTSAIGGSQAGYTGAQFSNWVAAQNTTWGSAATSFGSILGGIGGAFQGYQRAGVKGAVAGGLGGWGGATVGTMAGTAAASALSGTAMGATFGSVLPGIGTLIGAALGAAFGSKLFAGKWITKDEGYQLGVSNGELDSYAFEYQKKKGGLFGSNKKRTRLSALDDETQSALDETFSATLDTVSDLFKDLGVELEDGVYAGLNVDALQISTRDKTAEQIQKEMAAFFTTVGDTAVREAAKVSGAELGDFSLEGLLAFVQNLQGVNEALKHINLGLYDTSVQGARMAEDLSKVAGGLAALTQNIGTYYQAFFSDGEKASNVLADVRDQFKSMDQVLPTSRAAFRSLVEGIDKSTESGRELFATLMQLAGSAAAAYDVLEARQNTYYSGFYSAAENSARAMAEVREQFEQANIALPGSRAAFRSVVEGIDTGSEAGRKLKEQMIALAGAADVLYSAQESALGNAVSASMAALQRAVTAEKSSITEAYNARLTSLNDMLATAQSGAEDLRSLGTALGSALKALNGEGSAAVRTLRNQARATLESALATARAGGSLGSFKGLEDALAVISESDTSLYASLEDFNRDQGRNANLVAELNRLNGQQLSIGEQTVRSLKDQLKQAQTDYEARMKGLDAELQAAQTQIDLINGVDNSVKSVRDAIRDMNVAVVAALSAMGGKVPAQSAGTLVDSIYREQLGRAADTGGKQYWVDQLTSGKLNSVNVVRAINTAAAQNDLDSIYQKVLGRSADAGGASYWVGQVANGSLSYSQLEQAIRNAAIANGSIQKRAHGGLVTGPGSGTSDSILVRLSNGEYVLQASAVQMFGTELLDQMNAGWVPAFASGGSVGEAGPSLQSIPPQQADSLRGSERSRSDGDSATVGELRKVLEAIDNLDNTLRHVARHTSATARSIRQQNETAEVL